MKKSIIILIVLGFFTFLLAESEDSKKSKELTKFIKNEMKADNVPGAAIAVVKGNDIIFNECFGFADLENKTLVNNKTVFAIGSTSKPFTALLTAIEVGEEIIKWDDPITKYLPDFKLKILKQNQNDEVTIRDLLSHRTGFSHMPLIGQAVNWGQDPEWGTSASKEFTRENILKKALDFEPQDTFRTKHNYSNVGMIAAAKATEIAAKSKWDDLLKEKLFNPLGMENTSTSVLDLTGKKNVATGYMSSKEGAEKSLMINLDGIAPAGGLNSNLEDMCKFVKMLLNDGELEGREIIKKNEIDETWKSQIEGAELGGMLPGRNYGLGWFISEYKGYKVVEHPGNTIGFSSNIVLIPELNIGFVVLSNVMPARLQMTLTQKVWDLFVE